MPSLMELVDWVNKGKPVDPQSLELYENSSNPAEKFLAHHAHAQLGMHDSHQHLLKCLQAIEFADQKILSQYLSLCDFLNLHAERIEPTFRFAVAALARREYALGMEAIQAAIAFDSQNGGHDVADRDNCLLIASQFELIAKNVGWPAPSTLDWNNRHTRIAMIVSSITDDDAAARFLLNFAKYLDTSRFQLFIYSTESSAARGQQQFTQPHYSPSSQDRGAKTLQDLIQRNAQTWLAPCDGDALTSAAALVEQLVTDQIDIAIFDTAQSDPIAGVVASCNIAKSKINLCRKTPLYSPGISSVIYLSSETHQADKDFWISRGIESRVILEGGDIEEQTGPTPRRSALGIPQTAVVLATAGNDLDRTLTSDFVESIIQILQSHPLAIYLLIGPGELAWQKRRFEAAGVAKRVGYAGPRNNLPGFLKLCDIYLAEFPNAGPEGIMQAMSVEKPVVAISSSQSQITGNEESLAPDIDQFIQRVSNLIKDPTAREQIGKQMRRCVEQQFSFRKTAAEFEQLCDQLLGTVSATNEIHYNIGPPETFAAVA
jgi:predicted O-linked N-acetylglucosamine transferase (SPINDLY family)